MNKITVIGAGYVGLVTGVCFAQKKNNFVTVVERDRKKVESLLAGIVPFYEPGLDLLLKKAIEYKKIVFVSSLSQALLKNPEIVFSCVGTPSLPNGDADLSAVWNVAYEFGQFLNNYCLFVNKSTVPVGTAKRVNEIILEELNTRNKNIEFDVASNPEFLKEGDALMDFLQPDRVVVGVNSDKAKYLLLKLYAPFIKKSEQFISMNVESAELTKYASNAMLATRISFMNQLALLADKVGADIFAVKDGMAKDKRIGPSFLNAGIGYGGSCFPKDVKALVKAGEKNRLYMTLVDSVEKINQDMRVIFIKKILKFYKQNLSGKRVGIWGLAFKPETDDIRSAPSIDIIQELLKQGARVLAYDPQAAKNIKNLFGDKIKFASSAAQVLSEVDFLIILTEWKEFLNFNVKDFEKLKDKTIFDGRNLFHPVYMKKSGINYFCIGRNSIEDKDQDSSDFFYSKQKVNEIFK